MGRLAFAVSIAVNAAVFALISTATLVTVFIEPSEESLSWGLMWAASIPAIVILSAASVVAYPRYRSTESFGIRFGLYLALVVLVAFLGVACTSALVAMSFCLGETRLLLSCPFNT